MIFYDRLVSKWDMGFFNDAQTENDTHELGLRVAWALWDPLQGYWALEGIRG